MTLLLLIKINIYIYFINLSINNTIDNYTKIFNTTFVFNYFFQRTDKSNGWSATLLVMEYAE